MKVLLVQSLSKNLKPVFPVGLARIASAIRDKHDVVVFDPNLERGNIRGAIEEKLGSFDPGIIGISLRNIDSVDYIGREFFYPDFVKLVRFLRNSKPKAKIVVGGSGFSLFVKEIIDDNPEIDVGVFLEGEESFQEFLEDVDNPHKVKGLFVRNGSAVEFTGRRDPVNFQNLPMPAYELFDLNKYISRIIGIGIDGKRGCCLKCAYCPYPFLTGSNVRIRTPKGIVDEIEFLVSNYGIKNFAFVDPVFNIPIEHGENVCREILSRNLNIKWSCWTNEKLFTEEFARLAMEAGCVAFPFSTDAFSDKSLKLLNKNYTNKDILNAVDIAQKIDNINIGFSFFLNPPSSSTMTFLQMIWFLLKAKYKLGNKMKKIFVINRIRVEPHTKMRLIAIQEGLIKEDTNLLRPIYYTQRSICFIEVLYAAVIWPLNMLLRIKRFIRNGFKKRF